MAETIRRRVLVSGRVQGVWFRGATRQEALTAGVAGWVRNLPDGRVEAVFEGRTAAVGELLEFCRRGPPAARVEATEQHEETPRGEDGFHIR